MRVMLYLAAVLLALVLAVLMASLFLPPYVFSNIEEALGFSALGALPAAGIVFFGPQCVVAALLLTAASKAAASRWTPAAAFAIVPVSPFVFALMQAIATGLWRFGGDFWPGELWSDVFGAAVAGILFGFACAAVVFVTTRLSRRKAREI